MKGIPRIWVTSFGGTGSSFILKRRSNRVMPFIHQRPDYPFNVAIDTYDIHSYAQWDKKFLHSNGKTAKMLHVGQQWQRRTGRKPQPDKTIHENLIEFLNETPSKVLLFGKCSLSETWLTNNKITDAIFLVRNPIDSYDSLFGRSHSHWADRMGGIKSISAAEYYSKQWNKVVYDFLCSRSEYGTHILRYESLIRDLEEAGLTELAQSLQLRWYNKPKREFITPEVEGCIKDLTGKHYSVIYNK
jgi:hypothetical protein